MGFLELLGSVTGKGVKGSGVADAVGDLLSGDGPAGGLGGVLGKLDDSGLGDLGRSWVSKGTNLPISAEQIERVLGSEQVRPLAAKLGVSPEQAAAQIAKVLPQVVDRLTPDGTVPDQRAVDAQLGRVRPGAPPAG
jgi:uncharacterized protein YidB (DUF937 family)